MNSKHQLLFVLVMLLAFGCKNSFDEPVVSPGSANFSRVVAIGGAMVAGYSDDALYREAQENSFPAILARQFMLAGGGEFKQPLVNPGDGLAFDSSYNVISKVMLKLSQNCIGVDHFVRYRNAGDVTNLNWIGSGGPYNNLGVPAEKSFDILSEEFGRALPVGNPFYHRFASDNVTSSTILGDAELINHTFFILSVGREDIFQYAISGGYGNTNPDTNNIKVNDLTPCDYFSKSIDLVLQGLTGNNANGVMANIPDIESYPFFTTIPYDGLILTQQQADNLNATQPGYNFKEGANPFVTVDNGSTTPRSLVPGEMVLLTVPIDSINCASWGIPQHPLYDKYVLTLAQIDTIHDRIAQFNTKLKAVADQYNLAFVDLNSLFKTLEQGIVFNGVVYTNDYLKNSIFSIDGLTTNQRGNAFIANAFIRAINSKYKSTLPEVDINSYPGIRLP